MTAATQAGPLAERSTRVDAVRALAALAVFACHAFAEVEGYATDTYLRRIVLGGGLYGVFLFFALSGYLLYLPFAREGFGGGRPVRLAAYARNRAVRILPLYYVVLAVLLVVDGGTVRLLTRFATFTQSFSPDLVAGPVNGPMWSLVVELHFYVLLPLLAWGLARLGSRRRAALALLGLGAAAVAVRHVPSAPSPVLQYSFPATFHYFVPGMLLALLRSGDERALLARLPALARRADAWLLASLPVWALVFLDYDLGPLATVACGLTVGAAVLPLDRGGVDRLLELRALAWVGLVSYGLYLWHVPVLRWLPAPSGTGAAEIARVGLLGLAASLTLATATWHAVEAPAMRLRTWRPPRTWAPWAAVAGLALATRALLAAATWPAVLGPDPADYDRLGRALATTGSFGETLLAAGGGPTAFRPPGYPAFLAAVYRATGGSLGAARLVQVALGAATAVLVGLLAAALWRRRVGIAAGLLAAVYPPLVAASVAPMSESVFLPIMVGGLLAALHAGRRADARLAAVAGAACGLAVLVRPAGAFLVPIVALLALGHRSWRRAGLALGAAALVVAPWVAKASTDLGALVPVSTIDGFNLAGTYNADAASDPVSPGVFRPPVFVEELAPLFADRSLGEAELAAELRDAGLEHVRSNPGYAAEVVARSTQRLLDLAGVDVTREVYAVDYGFGPRWVADLAFASWWLLVPFAVAGIALGALRRVPWPLLVAPVATVATTVVVLGHARLRAPVEPFVVAVAAVAVKALAEAVVRRLRSPDGSIAALGVPRPAPSPFALGRRPALDGIRGIAVALVVAYHLLTFLVPERYEAGWFRGAFVGVDVFFALSGFLITTLLLEEARGTGRIRLGAFYARRALRLLPAVAGLLVAGSVYVVAAGLPVRDFARTVGVVASYTANWAVGDGVALTEGFGHMWSLAIEEQFYVVWPVALVAALRLVRGDRRLLAGILVAGIAAGAAARWVLFDARGVWSDAYFRTDARADQLLWGALAAVALQEGWVRVRPRVVLGGAALGTLGALAWSTSPFTATYYRAGASAVAVATVALVVSSLDSGSALGRALSWAPLRALGTLSYSLYLWHVPVIVAVDRWLGDVPMSAQVAVAVGAAVGSAALSRWLVEEPFLRRKHRFAAPPATAEAVAGPADTRTEPVLAGPVAPTGATTG